MPIPTLPRYGHNAHYHDYLLSQLPPTFELALDVGCGTGTFARRLATRARAVHAIDLSPEMIAQAATPHPASRNVTWIEGDVLTLDLPIRGYDVVTAIASVHHMPLDRGFARLGELARPGGVLAILGLYRPATITDYTLSAIATIADPLALASGCRKRSTADMPIRQPTTTLAEITAAAARHLPGARIRRHLFYRYSLTWQRAL